MALSAWKHGSPCSEGGLEPGSPGGLWPPGWFPGSQAATYRAHWSSVSPMADRDEGGRVKQQRASERGKKVVMTRGCSHTRPCSESESRSVMSNSLRPHGLYSPWNSRGQNAGVGDPFPFSRGSSQPRDWTQVSRIAGTFFISWATREAEEYWSGSSPADLPDPGIEPGSPALQVDSLPTELWGKPLF